MLLRRFIPLVAAIVAVAAGQAHAHFIWVVPTTEGKAAKASVYFSETASPDDPGLLDKILKAEAYVMGGRRGNEPQPLELVKKGDALVAEVPAELKGAPIVLRHTYGAMTRGGESFLLKYYAKAYPFVVPGTWRKVDDAELVPLEIVPEARGTDLALKVRWNGKPQSGVTVTVEGPGIEKKIEGTTGESGEFVCRLGDSGLFSIRARHVEATPGEYEGKAYGSIRHYATLALPYAVPEVQSASSGWPELPKGVTSFGGAIVGDWLYVYGGHYGQAHHYSRDEQSGDFLRLNLKDPGQWETLPGGPKLTGFPLVPYEGKLYRVGGFTATNAENEEQTLVSVADFARFDPETRTWESLPPLPEGRSSVDAAMIGSTLYVVGGWNMQPDTPTKWHETALSVDLSASPLVWKPIAPQPFHRRAIALAAFEGKLYGLGGMQEKGGPTLAVAIYDPATQKWSEGPSLLGSGMDGFGSSAFACGGRLYGTTMSGSLQRLSVAGDRWEHVAQLAHPRFFHRLLPWNDAQLVVVGGADMSVGKILPLERLEIPRVKTASR